MYTHNRFLATARSLAFVLVLGLVLVGGPARAGAKPPGPPPGPAGPLPSAVPAEGPNAIETVPGPGTADACRAASLGHTDDGSSPSVTLPFAATFFGTPLQTVWVNNNGNLTFDGALSTYTPSGLSGTGHQIIAPYFADVDTTPATSGLVTYSPQGATYHGRAAFCADWVDVGYYTGHTDLLASFQVVLADRSDTGAGNFDIVMNYDWLEWETGDASGGSGGLGGSSAVVGYSNAGTGTYQLPGSLTPGSFLDSNHSTGLIYHNVGSLQPGRYIYPVRGGQPPPSGTIVGSTYLDQVDPQHKLPHALVQVAHADGTEFHYTASSDQGDYLVNGLPDGDYYIVGWPPAGSTTKLSFAGPIHIADGQTVTGVDLLFTAPRPLPSDITITQIALGPGGIPVVPMALPLHLSKSGQCAGGSATYTVEHAGVTVASGGLTEGPAGTYSGDIPVLAPAHGNATITIVVTCPGGGVTTEIFDVYIDPSGVVRQVDGTPLAGATVTLYRADAATGPFAPVADGSALMSPSNRSNPVQTAADGIFHWDVIAGYYQVRAAKSGCVDPANPSQPYVESAVLTIPPPVTNLDLRLQCSGSPFSDVQPSDYFYQAVLYLAQHGIVSGYGDGTFRPYANTTRGQLAKIVVLARGWTLQNPPNPTFHDVQPDTAFYPFVETAVQHGIISGYGDGTFRPNASVTRGQLAQDRRPRLELAHRHLRRPALQRRAAQFAVLRPDRDGFPSRHHLRLR